MYQFPLAASRNRLVMDGPERRPRKAIAVQFIFKCISINPFRCKSLERQCISDTDVQIPVQFPGNTGRRIIDGGLRVRDVRRRQHPRQSGIAIKHVPGPPLHRHDRQLAFQRLLVSTLPAIQPLLIYEKCQLPHRQSVNIRNLEFTDKREEPGFHVTTFDFLAAERIRPVQYDYFNAFLCAGAHHQSQCADECI